MLDKPEGYDYPPFRPPNEAGSALIRVTHGCPWNRCEFCAMYKGVRFTVKALDEVREDIAAAREIYGAVETVFLGDSDNLAHPDLVEILADVREAFPEARRITSYARAKTVLRRPAKFLAAARRAGLSRLHLGLESGDEIVLMRLCKGADPREMAEAGQKAKQSGFKVCFYVLSGAGGKDRWREHAANSARILNRAQPDFIRLRTLTLLQGTPLYEKYEKGSFSLTPPLQRLKEVKLFLDNLEITGCFLASDHVSNRLWSPSGVIYRGIAGTLPEDKERMAKTLERAIGRITAGNLSVKDSNQLYREGLLSSL